MNAGAPTTNLDKYVFVLPIAKCGFHREKPHFATILSPERGIEIP